MRIKKADCGIKNKEVKIHAICKAVVVKSRKVRFSSHRRQKMSLKNVTVKGLNNDHAGMRDSKILREMGYEKRPVMRFGNDYLILWSDIPHPGHNTAEVINVTEFDQDSKFKILVTTAGQIKNSSGFGWVLADEGITVLTVYKNNSITDYANPNTAVLSYRIIPPTAENRAEVQEELDWQLEEFGPGRI